MTFEEGVIENLRTAGRPLRWHEMVEGLNCYVVGTTPGRTLQRLMDSGMVTRELELDESGRYLIGHVYSLSPLQALAMIDGQT